VKGRKKGRKKKERKKERKEGRKEERKNKEKKGGFLNSLFPRYSLTATDNVNYSGIRTLSVIFLLLFPVVNLFAKMPILYRLLPLLQTSSVTGRRRNLS
jgi:hypothetical protein